MDLSRFRSAPGAHLSGDPLKSQGTFPAQCRVFSARVVEAINVLEDGDLNRLADFARSVDRLDAAKASFVSVTQSFNTATRMGRLTLNVLLSFAQFEREVTAERIRNKIAASKKKGLWMGVKCGHGSQKPPRCIAQLWQTRDVNLRLTASLRQRASQLRQSAFLRWFRHHSSKWSVIRT